MGKKTFTLCFPFIYLMLLASTITSCKKEPGEGGAATIKGKLLAGNYHSPEASVTSEDGIAEEVVYIIYGDHTVPDRNEKTGPDGSFEFNFLRKGSYTLFAYSLDKDSKIPFEAIVQKTIEINDKKEAVEITDFVVFKEADKGGSSSIKGKVFLRDYDIAFTTLQSQYYKADEDVFIIYGNDTIQDDDTKTSYDGSFRFNGLRKGNYKLYVMSKDSAKIHDCFGCTIIPDSTIIKTIEITTNRQEILLPDFVIYKN